MPMIISKVGFYQRYVRKHVNQRINLQVLGSVIPEEVRKDFGITGTEDIVQVNGILVTCWRQATMEGWHERPVPLHKIQLELRDVLMNGRSWPFADERPRRASRRVSRFPFHFRVALDEIVWSASADSSGGNSYGIAGFLAAVLPAPGTPLEDQKAAGGCSSSRGDVLEPTPPRGEHPPRSLESRTVVADDARQGGSEVGRKLAQWFRQAKRNLREGGFLSDGEEQLYRVMIDALKRGVSFCSLIEIYGQAVRKEK